MTVFDKILINLHKGFEKIKYAAAVFSERVKVEVNAVHMRVRIDDLQSKIGELHKSIGRKLIELKDKESLPKSLDQFLKDDEVNAALEEIAKLKKESEDLKAELAREQSPFTQAAKDTEESAT